VSVRRLILLRHGRTEWNAQRRFQGQLDPPLDDVGRAQAYEVGGLTAALHPDLLVSSDAQRAMQTAVVVGAATGLAPQSLPALRERSLGHWEGLTREEVAERYPDEFADWIAGRDVSRRGGETRPEVAARARAAFDALPSVSMTIAVTHSATAMALCASLLGMDQTMHVLGPLANCHWSDLIAEHDDGGLPVWRLRAHNIGAPGVVAPLPMRVDDGDDDASDADA
jgi:glucosyl-3-phosphoglycerate phosphatase